jgi:hypothetical protein
VLCLWGGLIALGRVTGLLPGFAWWYGAWAVSSVGLLVYVLGGLKAAGAGREVYAALLRAPFYVLWKLSLYASRLVRRPTRGGQAPPEWVRTERVPMPVPVAPEPVKTPSAGNRPTP